VRQHAALGRDVKLVDHPVHRIQHPAQVLHVVSDRVDANHRVARAEGEPFIDLRGDTLHVVAGIVRLQAAAKGPRQTDGGIGFFDHRHFFTAVDQIGVGADLGHRSHHLGGQPFADKGDIVAGDLVVEHVFPQVADGPVFNPLIGGFVHVILDQARNAVLLVRDHRVITDIGHRHIGEHLLGGHALLRTLRRYPRQHIPRTQFVGFRQHLFYILKLINIAEQCGL